MPGPEPRRRLIVERLSDVPKYVPPEFPKVERRPDGPYLVLEDGRDCLISKDPVKFLGLIHHLSQKTWADGEFLRLAIERGAAARRWDISDFTRD